MTLAMVRMPSLRWLTPLTAAIWLGAFGTVVTFDAHRPAYADPAPSRDTAVAPAPAPPAQRNAPPDKIAPPLKAGTAAPPSSTDGFDAAKPTPDRLTPGHGDTIKPNVLSPDVDAPAAGPDTKPSIGPQQPSR